MTKAIPDCKTIVVVSFQGDRSRSFATKFLKSVDEGKTGRGPGPTVLECLLLTGHAGVSTDDGTTIFGFNPDSAIPVWEMINRLRAGEAFSGTVSDDTDVFVSARRHGLVVYQADIILPHPQFQLFTAKLDAEQKDSQYDYGFPNGDGDCNCVTWLERLGLPLLTGHMDEFIHLLSPSLQPSRRFGQCV